jgi:hypothetical protein
MKQIKKIVGAFLCALLTGNSFSQELLWEKSFEGKQDDISSSLCKQQNLLITPKQNL